MNNAKFKEICAAASVELKLADKDALGNAKPVTVNSAAIVLHFDDAIDPGTLQVFVDVGIAPEHDRLAIYRNLLAINCMIAPLRNAAFSLDDQNEHVFFSARVAVLERVSAQDIAGMVRSFASQARSALAPPAFPRPLQDFLEKSLQPASSGH